MKPIFTCQNCDYRTDRIENLLPVQHLTERVDPGEPMPAGECPECGALVQEDTPSATPGPWQVQSLGAVTWILDADGDRYLAEIIGCDEEGRFETNEARRAANAELMAAAPKLQETLSTVLGNLQSLAAAYPEGIRVSDLTGTLKLIQETLP